MEFVRRFSLHILPKRFVRIRHYGILSSTAKRGKFENVKASLKVRVRKQKRKPIQKRKVYNPSVCSVCKKESMIRILDFDFRGPPASLLQALSKQTIKVNENSTSEKAS
jgi:formate dehydrogenase assembly factor FdhD